MRQRKKNGNERMQTASFGRTDGRTDGQDKMNRKSETYSLFYTVITIRDHWFVVLISVGYLTNIGLFYLN
jgi:hypothetical protein